MNTKKSELHQKQHRSENEADSATPQWLIDARGNCQHRKAAIWVRDLQGFLSQKIPPLEREDLLGLPIHLLGANIIRVHHPRSKALRYEHIVCVNKLALQTVLRANPQLVISAGVYPLDLVHPLILNQQVSNWWNSWYRIFLEAMDAKLDGKATLRQECLVRFHRAFVVEKLAANASTILRRYETAINIGRSTWDSQITPSEVTPPGIAGYMQDLMTKPQAFINSLGMSACGRIAPRDRSQPGRKRDGRSRWGRRSRLGVEEVESGVESPRERSAAEEAEAIDAAAVASQIVEVVSAVMAQRLGSARAGSARAWVLEYGLRLERGELTVTELAEMAGLAPSSISRAWSLEKESLAKDPQLAPRVRRAAAI